MAHAPAASGEVTMESLNPGHDVNTAVEQAILELRRASFRQRVLNWVLLLLVIGNATTLGYLFFGGASLVLDRLAVNELTIKKNAVVKQGEVRFLNESSIRFVYNEVDTVLLKNGFNPNLTLRHAETPRASLLVQPWGLESTNAAGRRVASLSLNQGGLWPQLVLWNDDEPQHESRSRRFVWEQRNTIEVFNGPERLPPIPLPEREAP